MKLKRTEITVEVDELVQVSVHGNRLTQAWCNACGAKVVMVAPQQAAAMARVSVRTVNGWVESDEVHFLETEDGLLLLCVNSLKPELLRQEVDRDDS